MDHKMTVILLLWDEPLEFYEGVSWSMEGSVFKTNCVPVHYLHIRIRIVKRLNGLVIPEVPLFVTLCMTRLYEEAELMNFSVLWSYNVQLV